MQQLRALAGSTNKFMKACNELIFRVVSWVELVLLVHSKRDDGFATSFSVMTVVYRDYLEGCVVTS